MMQSIIDVALPGLVVGCIYGLIGMSFAITYHATRVVNFAMGEVMMLIAYIAFNVQAHLGLGIYGFIPMTIVISAVVGLVVEYVIIRPMRGKPIFAIVMSTIGLAIALRSAVALIWGAEALPIGIDLTTTYVHLLGINLSVPQIMVVCLLVLACLGMAAFFRFTRMGLLMRATASNEATALLLGVEVGRIQAIAWAGSAVIAGLTGVLLAMIQSLGPDLFLIGFKGFPATVLGGLDSVIGSGVGGAIIGVIENATGRFYGAGAKEVAGLVIIVFILMVRPSGLFGHRAVDRV